MIHDMRKALHIHVHHLSTPHPGPWSSRVGRSLLMQREERVLRSLIYKGLPVLWMPGASARCLSLHTPVETVTSPRPHMLHIDSPLVLFEEKPLRWAFLQENEKDRIRFYTVSGSG